MIGVELPFWSYPSKQNNIFKLRRQISLFEQFTPKGFLCFMGKGDKTLTSKHLSCLQNQLLCVFLWNLLCPFPPILCPNMPLDSECMWIKRNIYLGYPNSEMSSLNLVSLPLFVTIMKQFLSAQQGKYFLPGGWITQKIINPTLVLLFNVTIPSLMGLSDPITPFPILKVQPQTQINNFSHQRVQKQNAFWETMDAVPSDWLYRINSAQSLQNQEDVKMIMQTDKQQRTQKQVP